MSTVYVHILDETTVRIANKAALAKRLTHISGRLTVYVKKRRGEMRLLRNKIHKAKEAADKARGNRKESLLQRLKATRAAYHKRSARVKKLLAKRTRINARRDAVKRGMTPEQLGRRKQKITRTWKSKHAPRP